MPPRRRKRLDPALFALDVEGLKAGRYTDAYFVRTREVLRADRHAPAVVMQVTGKRAGVVCGVDECVAILRLCADDFSALTVHALYEGDRFEAWDTVLTIEGTYDSFAILETPLLGILSRRTGICTNTRRCVEAARSKPVIFFGARDDHFMMQPGDGFAAQVGGMKDVSTDAQASWMGGRGVGTMPHALIAAYGGDTVKAAKRFAKHTPEDVPVVALVDYANDSVGTSLAVARALGDRLGAVRLDTSEHLVDTSVVSQMGSFRPTGVNPSLVWNVRNALDGEGFGDVKIVVSGGFDAERIRAFEEEGVPVDAYGVGGAVYAGGFDFTADIVEVNGQPQSKAGRERRENPKLEKVR